MKNKLLAILVVGLAASTAQAWTITSTGVIYTEGFDYRDNTGLFGVPGGELFGLNFVVTITTDPLLNTFGTSSSISFRSTIGGDQFADGSGAPYTIITTVNGVSYTQTGIAPWVSYSYLLNALSVNDVSTTLQDQAYQGILSNLCYDAYSTCTDAYILAYSLDTPFVPILDFDQSIFVSSGLDPLSNTYFSFQDSNGLYTQFYGSIDTLSINAQSSVPEPGTLALLGLGLAGIGFSRRNKLN